MVVGRRQAVLDKQTEKYFGLFVNSKPVVNDMVKRKISQQQSSPALPRRIFQQSRQHSSAESQRVIPIMKAQQTMIDVIKTPKTHGRSFTSAAKTSSINMTTMDTKQSESYLRNVKRTQLPTPAHPNLDFKSDLHS